MAPNTKSEVAGPGDGYDESSESRSVVKEILYEGMHARIQMYAFALRGYVHM